MFSDHGRNANDCVGVVFQTYKIPETKPCSTHLLLYLSVAGFVCGLSLLIPWFTG